MEHIKQIRELFYSNNIELVMQLIKSQGYELRNVLQELYDIYHLRETYSSNDHENVDNYFELIKSIDDSDYYTNTEIYKNPYDKEFVLWMGSESELCDTVEECLDKLYSYLIENYG